MMRRITCLTAVLAVVFCFCAVDSGMAEEKKSEKKSDEWTDMFCCKDLGCWDVLKCEVEFNDGVLLLKGGNGLVQTKKQYANFVFHFECKALNEEMWDSGVYFRYTSVPEGRPWPRRYQVNMRKGMEGNVGGIEKATSTGLFKPKEWNSFELTVDGTEIALKINDKPAWKADGIEDPKGFIALQAEIPGGGQFLFRNVKIKETK